MFGGNYHKSMKKYRGKKAKITKRRKTAKKGKTLKKRGGGVSSEIARAALPLGIYSLQRLLDKPKNKRKLRKFGRSITRKLLSVVRR